MPDPKALTPDQIELLRGLPSNGELGRYEPVAVSHIPAHLYVTWETQPGDPYTMPLHRRSEAADLLLATIDTAVAAERKRIGQYVAQQGGGGSNVDRVCPCLSKRPATPQNGEGDA